MEILYCSEATFRDLLAKELKGLTEVSCPAGRIDIVTADEVIEVKVLSGSQWKAAIGQVISYGHCYPKHRKRIHLFGVEPSKEKLEVILGICLANNIYVSAHICGSDKLWRMKNYIEYGVVPPYISDAKIPDLQQPSAQLPKDNSNAVSRSDFKTLIGQIRTMNTFINNTVRLVIRLQNKYRRLEKEHVKLQSTCDDLKTNIVMLHARTATKPAESKSVEA